MNAKSLFSVFCTIVLVLGVFLPCGQLALAAPETGPSGTLELVITSKENREVEASGTYSDSFGSWATCLYWGHDDLSVCFDGVDGTFSEPHQFPGQGTYTITLVVEGDGGPFILEREVTFYDPPFGSLTTFVVENNEFLGSVSGSYQNALDWGACIVDWGHIGETNQPVCFPGTSGSFSDVQHTWPGLGVYIIEYQIQGPEEILVLTSTIGFFSYVYLPIVVTSPPAPSGNLEVVLSNPAIREVRASGDYTNALDWGACVDWGDGQKVCFPGTEGTFSNVFHQYRVGATYIVTLTVTGEEGTTPYEVFQEVQIP